MTVPLRVVVADDEPVAAAVLADDLSRLGCDVVAITARGDDAVAACARYAADACFTDIAMPQHDGLEVARTLRAHTPQLCVVFVSAHAHFAVQAFGADVVDYVLKPARRSRLAEAVERVRRVRAERAGASDTAEQRLIVVERGSVHTVPVKDIEWVQADGYSAWLHTAKRSYIVRERMHKLEERLGMHGFLRVHRSALVRQSAILTLEQPAAGDPAVVLRSGTRVKVARDRVSALRHALISPDRDHPSVP
ncbi:LytR/AlgR family response regulator transcription factor [Gemmatimonas phototrophica]|uniref:LytR/AlgR family response regulator transcription factor n=1 Tax=Gemmatimonas phototrophica TaxID=1379270 RepID=UPI0006A70A9E|nr:LytTR family DNA-binding domain-containing protein [Gemmatimonas phototrophica]